MRALAHLIAVALASAVGTAALAASTWSAAAGLASVPVAWWSTAQIAQAAIVLACGLGTAGCLWHLASAGLALTVLLQDALATADARGAPAGAPTTGNPPPRPPGPPRQEAPPPDATTHDAHQAQVLLLLVSVRGPVGYQSCSYHLPAAGPTLILPVASRHPVHF